METITDEILEKADEDIQEILSDKRLSTRERKTYEVLHYFLLFLMTDHKKINKIEKASIGLWVSKNPKLTIISLLALVAIVVPDIRQALWDYFSALSWVP